MTLPAVILAGGRGTRMGGVDKALLPLGDGVVLDHLMTRLRPQVGRIAINANGDAARFDRFDLPVLPDDLEDAGPLAGVCAAMRWAAGAGADYVVTVAGDTPFIPTHMVTALRLGRESTDAPIAICEAFSSTGRRLHPTCALWSTALADQLADALAQGTRKLGLWAEEAGALRVAFHLDPDPFFNINTEADLLRARAFL
ncbi:molybdopterin-guanine dinucleotide biosynthesis protein A [Rubricella aquisinus]|uniref:Molybdenum cofactor guanylyltransferase n=1 Tax=Rubricella aquisinus TaxID=2028108 RepID=A0A840WZD2_9RHOB|nr:molybdenum cofactor guanylyltransferase MobA [Rubricella aquisinus]MBB5515016.1 molybdopterin-guanine dinucleotide biosynthesis protein A [Rubricella aquisinus]